MDYPLLERGKKAFHKWAESAFETSAYMFSEVIKQPEWLYSKGYKEGYEAAMSDTLNGTKIEGGK